MSGHRDDPAASWPAVTVMTAPFAAAINPPPGAVPGTDAGTPAATPTYVPTNFSIPLQFNNLTVDPATQLSQYVQVRAERSGAGAGPVQLAGLRLRSDADLCSTG